MKIEVREVDIHGVVFFTKIIKYSTSKEKCIEKKIGRMILLTFAKCWPREGGYKKLGSFVYPQNAVH